MQRPDIAAMVQLQRLGWEWYEHGVVVTARTNRGDFRVWVPLSQLWLSFGKAFPEQQSVGYPQTVGGLFGFVKRAARSVSRSAKKAVKRVKQAGRGIARKARAAALYASAPTYALHSLPGMRRATKFVAQNAPFEAARSAARATLAAQGHLDRFRKTGKVNVTKVAREAATIAAQSRQGKAAAARVMGGYRPTRAVRRAIHSGLSAERKLAGILARADRGDAKARAQAAAIRAILAR